ncbi:DHA2 family efflux MFS transporter permease subunit [Streptomyces sp. NPDC094034]|uniref:DHA2 family efflux MFS transporter permease subunit n=1 Tax=Streptomyces sp. NPDC094034 TaxID=3155309 RepID=UPI0033273DA8
MTIVAPDDAPAPLDRPLRGVITVVTLGSIMSIVDGTIVNVAMDVLTRTFEAPLSTIQWVSTGYLLSLAMVVPLTGWAADRFGTKRLYLWSIALFTVCSVLAGLAWSAPSLIIFRVLQGLGGGMIVPAGMTMITRAAGPSRLARVMSLVGVPMLIGPIAAPILGGWFIESFSWRWIFFINAPIGALALVLGARLLQRDNAMRGQRLDWGGAVLLSPGLALTLYGISGTNNSTGFADAAYLVPFITGLVLLVLFVTHAQRAQSPLIDVRLFGRGAMTASTITSFLQSVPFMGMMFLLPLYYQLVRGENSLSTGLLISPLGIGAAVSMLAVGRFSSRIAAGSTVCIGMIPFLAGLVGLAFIGPSTPLWFVVACTLIVGIGAGATQVPTMTAALQTLAHQDIARANTVFNILQRAGGSLGVTVFSVLLTTHLGAGGSLDTAPRGPAVASVFGYTFWWALGLSVASAIASVFLLSSKPNSSKTRLCRRLDGWKPKPTSPETAGEQRPAASRTRSRDFRGSQHG